MTPHRRPGTPPKPHRNAPGVTPAKKLSKLRQLAIKQMQVRLDRDTYINAFRGTM